MPRMVDTTPETCLLNLLYRYAELIDAGDFAGVAGLFRHGCIRSPANDSVSHGYEAVLKLYQSATRIYPDTGTPHTQHCVSNPVIKFDPAAGEARIRSRFTVYQSLPNFPLQVIIAGDYHDTFHQIEGEWCFKERIMLPRLFGDLSRHLLFDPALVR